MAAIVLFLTGSALSGLAGSMLELVLFRALQGLGAGGLIVTAMAVIARPGRAARARPLHGHDRRRLRGRERGRPAAGRAARRPLSWRWVFYVNLPVGAAALFVIAAKLPGDAARASASRSTCWARCC